MDSSSSERLQDQLRKSATIVKAAFKYPGDQEPRTREDHPTWDDPSPWECRDCGRPRDPEEDRGGCRECGMPGPAVRMRTDEGHPFYAFDEKQHGRGRTHAHQFGYGYYTHSHKPGEHSEAGRETNKRGPWKSF